MTDPVTWICLVSAGMSIALLPRMFLIATNLNWFRQGFFGDSSVHWLLVKTVRKDRKFEFIPQYLISDEPSSYPRAFHHFAALFPLPLLKRKSWLPNLVIFSVFGGLFSAYAWYFFTIAGLPALEGTVWAYAFFVFSVSNLTVDGPAIAYLKLSERLYARLFGATYYVAMAVGMDYEDDFSLIVAVVSGAIAGTASTFGRQAIWFVSPIVACLTASWIPVAVMLLASLGSYLISGKQLIRGIKYTILLWRTYSSHTKKSEVQKRVLSQFVDFRFLFGKGEVFRRRINHLLFREPTRAMARYPELFCFAFAWPLLSHPPLDSGLAVVIASVLVYALTSTQRFNHLGESYRYLEYNLTFLLPLFLAGCVISDPSALAFAPWLLLVSFLFAGLLWRFLRLKNLSSEDRLQQFVDQLALTEKDVVFPLSMRLGADICTRAECKSFWWQPGNVTQQIYEHFLEEYPYLKRDWKPLAREFGVTHVVVNKKEESMIDWSYDFSELPKLLDDDQFVAYSVPATILESD